MTRCMRVLAVALAGGIASVLLVLGTVARAERDGDVVTLEESRIFIEYNSTDNDLGFHVFLDGEDWRRIRILNPDRCRIFEVEGKGGFKLGLTELFFEGAEPSLKDVPLHKLLALFPEGDYRFVGKTAAGEPLRGTGTLTHAIPAGPEVSVEVDDGSVIIRWTEVTAPPEGFPDRPIVISGYQVIVESFQLTLPPSARSVTVPPEFVKALASGEHQFEVLAIEEGGNQTLTEGAFNTQ